jgi:hypothetical protein
VDRSFQFPGNAQVRFMDERAEYWGAVCEVTSQTIRLTSWRLLPQTNMLTYARADHDHLSFAGQFGTNSVAIKLRRFDEWNLPRVKRGFHWIQEFPFNR